MNTKAGPGSTIRCFAAGQTGVHSWARDDAIRAIREAVAHPYTESESDPPDIVWMDITGPEESDAALLRDGIGIHPLAVDDCLRGRQRPKIDRYPGYFLIVFYATRINPDRARMALNEIHVFVGASFLITVHDQEVPEVTHAVAAWRMDPNRLRDPGSIAHSLLDLVVDAYFPVLEHFSERLEQMEARVFDDTADATLEQAFLLRQELISMRRVLAPERDALSSLVRHDLPFFRPDLVPYFQDIHDHVLRVTEEIDAFRDVLTGLVELQATKASNRLNEIVQTLTTWSIILMTVSVIAGIYGMNFVVMPELEVPWGYYAALGLMVATALSLGAFFRRRGWL